MKPFLSSKENIRSLNFQPDHSIILEKTKLKIERQNFSLCQYKTGLFLEQNDDLSVVPRFLIS